MTPGTIIYFWRTRQGAKKAAITFGVFLRYKPTCKAVVQVWTRDRLTAEQVIDRDAPRDARNVPSTRYPALGSLRVYWAREMAKIDAALAPL